ncbi:MULTISPECIES: ACT domain-containing protein [unclassified Marinobacter]|uniref:ACT domain-containing protein n=1 Tax=unclassified Marinobacter TaxID=83889 RepID=UPI0026E39621|nr:MULTISPECIES: ACT domain-containing protein [unclassified Marinobacter]MDO6442296.1 ACT domain-containing protein [Marinobacter sp. 2_MG-2023]MDO6824934.1 ACT domain-containing protein [Marinobacter sp. 1_MG-2023]
MKRKQFLQDLIKQLSPALDSKSYVYCTVPEAKYGELGSLNPIVSIAELEGLTLVIPLEQAKDEGLDYYRVFRRITLKGHSSLEALGLTSVVTTLLTERGITTNVIAGFYHDHMFVPSDRADEAMAALKDLANEPNS